MPADQINRAIPAGARYFAWAGTSGTTTTNVTISPTSSNGTPTLWVAAFATGNSANITANGNVVVYSGNTPSTTTLLYTLVGNSGATSPFVGYVPLNGSGNITLNLQGNAPAGWITYLSSGPGGQVD